jgi:hypothetical protein
MAHYTENVERQYWVFDWFDSMGITDLKGVDRALGATGAVTELRRAANANEPHSRAPLTLGGVRILAGKVIDLSGALDCLGWECRLRQVDHLLSRVWIYFDEIVLSDWMTERLCSLKSSRLNAHQRDTLLSDLKVLFVLWRSGAAPYLRFRMKPHVCQVHWPERIRKLQLSDMEVAALSAVPQVASTAAISFEACPHGTSNCVHYSVSHPLFENTVWGSFRSDSVFDSDFNMAAARSAIKNHFDQLVADIWAARHYETSLGCTVESHQRFLQKAAEDRESIAFDLELPFLAGIEYRTLFRLRTAESKHSLRFRDSLRKAFDERLRMSRGGCGSPIFDPLVTG